MRDKLVIIRVDGGISSQISFVSLGKAFEAKGYEVQYDLSWFENEGIGFYNPNNGYDKVYNVSFDIPKAFPTLPLKIANKTQAKHYKRYYFADSEDIINFTPPLYVGGYLGRNFDVHFKSLFMQHFNPKESSQIGTPFAKIKESLCACQACGIHLRRGDLSKPHRIYGEPTTLEYFSKAISLIERMYPASVFYIFSDDIEWAREHLIPLFEKSTYRICDVNTPSEGYLDLYLLSLCKNLISSHGSLGVYAKLLSPHNPLLISPKIRDWLFFKQPNIMFVNWGEVEESSKDDIIKDDMQDNVRGIFDSIAPYAPPPPIICQKQIPIMALSSPKKEAIS